MIWVLFIILSKNIPAFADTMTDTIKSNYLELKKIVASNPEKDHADIFDEDIEQAKREMGIGFNFGNSLDWAFENNKVRRYQLRISVGYDGKEYLFYESYASMTGNLYTPGNYPVAGKDYGEFHLTPNEAYSPQPADPINYLSVSLSNQYPEASKTDVTLIVNYLSLLDKNQKELITDPSALREYVTPVRPDGVTVLTIPLNTTVGEISDSAALLRADMQLDHFISDYKNDPKLVYKDTYNGEPAADDELAFLWEQGFRTIRLPVTWFAHMDSEGTVDPEWFVDVNRIVDRILSYGFYVIVNIHHDAGKSGWIRAEPEYFGRYEFLYRYLVLQIAENFRDYGEKLILSGPNEVTNFQSEVLLSRQAPPEFADTLNRINQIFVDEVRCTGRGNTNRILVVGPWYAYPENLPSYRQPDDSADNKIFTELHTFQAEKILLYPLRYFDNSKTSWPSQYNLLITELGVKRESELSVRTEIMEQNISRFYRMGIPVLYWDDGGNYALMTNGKAEWDAAYGSDRVAEAMLSAFEHETSNSNRGGSLELP